jgi:hypothetical protein
MPGGVAGEQLTLAAPNADGSCNSNKGTNDNKLKGVGDQADFCQILGINAAAIWKSADHGK